jgi:hypothetical protein
LTFNCWQERDSTVMHRVPDHVLDLNFDFTIVCNQ